MKKVLSFLFVIFLCLSLFPRNTIAATDCTGKGVDGDFCGNGNIGAKTCCTPDFTCVTERSSNNTLQVCRPSNNTNETGKANVTLTAVPVTPPQPPCAGQITENGCTSVNTAFGVWNTDPAKFVQSLMSILLSISGGIAVLIIIFAGYTMMTSQGDPEKVQGAREQITAAIIGLLFLIFSVVILEIIGVDILHLPGFSGGTTGTNKGDTALDATACNILDAGGNNAQCGLTAGGSGLFCGAAGSATNCHIGGRIGVLYRCSKNANGTYTSQVAQVCPNSDCKQINGAINADACGTGAVKHYACQSNGLCQEDPNGTYTTGNCNNACN